MSASARRGWLVGILVLAAVLRLWALDLSLPNVDGRPDEREMLAFTAAFPSGDLNPRWFVYPNLFLYLSWLWIEGVLAVRRLVVETPDYATALREALPTVLYAGRLLSAAAGTATVAVLYAVASRRGRTARGLVAAALLATCWLHVRDSHFLKTEALLALGIVVAIAALARWAERGRRADALLAGVAVGLAIGIKYPAVLLAVPAWVADRLRARAAGTPVPWWRPSGDLLAMAAAATVTFLVSCPYLLLDFARTLDTATFLGLALYAPRPDSGPSPVDPAGAWIAASAFGYHLTVSLRYGLGLVAFLAIPPAAVLALRRREPLLVLAVAFVAAFGLVAGASPVRLARYMTPLTPLVALLVADGVVWIADRARAPRRAAVLLVATAVVIAEPLLASVRADRIAAADDTRVLTTRWLERELDPNARIAVLGSYLLPQGAPALPRGVRRFAGPAAVETFRDAGVTHVVTHDHPLLFSTVPEETLGRLAPALRLLVEFTPFTDEPRGGFEQEDAYYVPFYDFAGVVRPGPHVRIYAFAPSPETTAPGPSAAS